MANSILSKTPSYAPKVGTTKKKGSTTKKSTGIFNADVSSALKKLAARPKKTTVKKSTGKNVVQQMAGKVIKGVETIAKSAGKGKGSSTAAATAGKTSGKKETFNLDAEVKKTMSGAYGSGKARKEALGANYDKVQAEINKRFSANKSKTSAPKSTATTPAKSERVEIGSLPLKKITEADLKPSPKPAAPRDSPTGGSGLGAKERLDKEMEKQGFRRGGSVKRRMMTGGMVNSNAKISAIKTPGSRGTKVGLNKRIAKPKGKRG